MSTSMEAHLVFGFVVPTDIKERLARMGHTYIHEWLEAAGMAPAEQINAGRSNGGNVWFLVGVRLCSLVDFTRSDGWEKVKRLEPRPTERNAVLRAAKALGIEESPALYLVGDVA